MELCCHCCQASFLLPCVPVLRRTLYCLWRLLAQHTVCLPWLLLPLTFKAVMSDGSKSTFLQWVSASWWVPVCNPRVLHGVQAHTIFCEHLTFVPTKWKMTLFYCCFSSSCKLFSSRANSVINNLDYLHQRKKDPRRANSLFLEQIVEQVMHFFLLNCTLSSNDCSRLFFFFSRSNGLKITIVLGQQLGFVVCRLGLVLFFGEGGGGVFLAFQDSSHFCKTDWNEEPTGCNHCTDQSSLCAPANCPVYDFPPT